MSKIIKIGVLGGYRGRSMIKWCVANPGYATVVAICDKNPEIIENCAKYLAENSYDCALYSNFDDFLGHDMDAVVLANYAHEHAPFAIRCMEAGLHVFSEVLPVANLKEAVELTECVERTGKIYAYGENYCYFMSVMEMKKRFQSGELGDFEYGEGEYVHDCESIWPSITYGERDHWRNQMSPFYYCTHSAGPIIHITGLRPASVVGFPMPYAKRHYEMGMKSSGGAVEMVTFENGSVFKSLHFNLKGHNTWYCLYGSRGRMESGREGLEKYATQKFYGWFENDDKTTDYVVSRPNPEGEPFEEKKGRVGSNQYTVTTTKGDDAPRFSFGHAGSDFYSMLNFVKAVRGDDDADIIDVYEALDMFFVGHFANLSAIDGGVPKKIPNFRNKQEREVFRNDTACSFKDKAGDMLLPAVNGCQDIPDEIYENVRKKFEEQNNKK